MELIMNIDGGARGNPGPAGAGVVVREPSGRSLFESGYFLGEMTNNMAEYHGLLRGLDAAAAWPDARLTICSDSELMVRQITGQYRVRNATLAQLYEQAQKRLLLRDQWRIRHVPREENRRADELANMAMDAGRDVCVIDRRAGTRPAPGPNGDARPAPAAPSPDAPWDPKVLARCVTGSSAAACPAPCQSGQQFTFGSTASGPVCLDGLASMLSTVLSLRDAAEQTDQSAPPLTVRCARRDCGAVFELTAE